jgi:XTP/dITP diphosphohydrolase
VPSRVGRSDSRAQTGSSALDCSARNVRRERRRTALESTSGKGIPLQFVLASFNRDKLREFRAWFKNSPIELMPLFEFSGASAPVETGATLEENARLKARAAMELTGLAAIADDTGLEIEALNGRPGVRSSRYAGISATDRMNLDTVLEQMKEVAPGARKARFRTVMVACFPRRPEVMSEGILEGAITAAPRGDNGFGYDPIFEIAGLGKTLAELALPEKNEVSHRVRAAKTLMEAMGMA